MHVVRLCFGSVGVGSWTVKPYLRCRQLGCVLVSFGLVVFFFVLLGLVACFWFSCVFVLLGFVGCSWFSGVCVGLVGCFLVTKSFGLIVFSCVPV